jgi:hypothetical protein
VAEDGRLQYCIEASRSSIQLAKSSFYFICSRSYCPTDGYVSLRFSPLDDGLIYSTTATSIISSFRTTMTSHNNPFEATNFMLNNHSGKSNDTNGMLAPPIYNPCLQTSSEFGQQMGRLLQAPIDATFFQIPEMNGDFEGLFEYLGAQNLYGPVSRACPKGHNHLEWPRKGDLDIKKCERRCDYCKKEVGSAAALRKVSANVLLYSGTNSQLTRAACSVRAGLKWTSLGMEI